MAHTPNRRAEFARLRKVEMEDMSDDTRDIFFVIANYLLLAWPESEC